MRPQFRVRAPDFRPRAPPSLRSVAATAHAYKAEPYSYAEARALADELGLSEPVAIALVRRGYRTPEAARAFLDADESHAAGASTRWARSCERVLGGDRGRAADHRPRRLRRRRGLRDDDRWSGAARPGRRLRLADPRPDGGRLRARRAANVERLAERGTCC